MPIDRLTQAIERLHGTALVTEEDRGLPDGE